jgi:hypothetical protein
MRPAQRTRDTWARTSASAVVAVGASGQDLGDGLRRGVENCFRACPDFGRVISGTAKAGSHFSGTFIGHLAAAAKEELQSANEELTTTNDELRNRNRELGQPYREAGRAVMWGPFTVRVPLTRGRRRFPGSG